MVYQLKNDKIFYIYNITRVLNKKKIRSFHIFRTVMRGISEDEEFKDHESFLQFNKMDFKAKRQGYFFLNVL